jgi:hypothetical protein
MSFFQKSKMFKIIFQIDVHNKKNLLVVFTFKITIDILLNALSEFESSVVGVNRLLSSSNSNN